MNGRIVEIAEDRRHLQVSRGFLIIKSTGDDSALVGQIPLDDIAAVIANSHGLSYSNNILVALAQRGAPFVLCAANHHTVGVLWPLDGNYHQAKRIERQILASKPLQKRLWADIVKAKVRQQMITLERTGSPVTYMTRIIKKVRSGDPENCEAQAARYYWQALLGADFRRDQNAAGANSLLNYGYTIMRSATARGVVAAGLHPSLGLHHSNDQNAMRLVDDLMEPFRPIVDFAVWRLVSEGRNEITIETKKILANLLYANYQTSLGRTPLITCIQRLCTSLAQVFVAERKDLELPQNGFLSSDDYLLNPQ